MHIQAEQHKPLRSFVCNVLFRSSLESHRSAREGERGREGGEMEGGTESLLTCSLCPLPSPSHWSNRIRTKMIGSREGGKGRERKKVTGAEEGKGRVETCAELNLSELFQLGSC